MAERTGDYEWLVEGEDAGIVFYAPGESALDYPRLRSGLDATTRLPGVVDPVHAAASPQGSGWVASSTSHVAPGLVSAPRAGILLAADTPMDRLGVPPGELPRLFARNLSEAAMPRLSDSELLAACESGAWWAAGEGLIEEEDLDAFGSPSGYGDPDALGRRALAAGAGEWDPRPGGGARIFEVGEILDSQAAESLGVSGGSLLVVASAGAGELGRLALEGHRQRMISREVSDADRLVAAPRVMEEAADLLAADAAVSGYAQARASLLIYALRRALGEVAGTLTLACVWSAGGFEERGGITLHRRSLARLGEDGALVCGNTLALGAGAMSGSAPAFGAEGGREWPWEEAGLLRRVALLREPGERPD